MIRKLTHHDHEQLMLYLSEEAAFNLFMIGDIENYGYEADFQEIWGEFDDNRNLAAVLLRYHHSYLPYARNAFNLKEIAKIIMQDDQFEVLSGKQDIITRFQEHVPVAETKEMYFSELSGEEQLEGDEEDSHIYVQKATEDDVEGIYNLRMQIAEFRTGSGYIENLRRDIRTNAGRTYMIKQGNEVVATVSTTAENTKSLLIFGVATHPSHRQKGYATLCLKKLCKEVLREGKSLCLFYDNPAAGSIYTRIGFKEIGKWTVCYAKPAQ